MEQIQKYWEELSAVTKKRVSIGIGVSVLVGLVAIFVTGGEQVDVLKDAYKHQQAKKHVTLFADKNVKQLSMERVQARLIKMNREIEQSHREIKNLKNAIQRKTAVPPPTVVRPSMTKTEIEAFISKTVSENIPEPIVPANESISEKGNDKTLTSVTDGETHIEHGTAIISTPQDIELNPFARVEQPVTQNSTGQGQTNHQSNVASQVISTTTAVIRTIEPVVKKISLHTSRSEKAFIPMGSIISGVLLNGIDAGTGQGARKNPYPVLIRVKKEAILPNRYTSEHVKECFILASGYGELSSERAYLRSEGIGCVNEDGGVIELKANMYAVGEDGKAGVHGRLVNKQGQLLAKSLAAGILSVFASVFNQQPIPTIATTNGLTGSTTTPFQSVLSQSAIQSGLVKGTSNAMDRLAKFYLEAADQIFPVLEIDSKRRVTFIVSHGFDLSSPVERTKE